ncbi:head morphogenesis protein [Methylobacterium terrae]|uniref:Head morphogenesis protein n=1 Tax=Methylobacterium terrae TaxID=2202827 RepID=A0A2U8WLL3_9HYPH|nr:phage minor head protein [Methylobacterium terrae]AWN47134.1 head morphogenesis protein [Methylobacterium terrae]
MTVPPSLEQLISAWEPRIARAFLAAIATIRDEAQIAIIARMVGAGDVAGALRAVGVDQTAFRPLDIAVAQAFETAGNTAAAEIPARREAGGHRLEIRFNACNPAAESWLRNHSSGLVREIVEDQRTAIRAHLEAGMQRGANPTDVALDLVGRINPSTGKRSGGVIGLTSMHEAWARNYADELARLDPAALNRKLRDKRYDAALNKAIESGKALAPERVAKMIEAYRNRALKARADGIGRTEAMASMHQAQIEASAQAIAAGQVDEAALEKIWHSAKDARVRDTHRAMDGQRVPFRAEFVSPSGARLRFPGDPEAPAAEIIQCRCWMQIRFNAFRGVR